MTVSLVTGAGSGIGAATAIMLGERGDSVVCVDINGEAARSTASRIDRAIGVEADVTDKPAYEKMTDAAIDEFGDLNFAVACAGVGGAIDALSLEIDEFRRMIDVNLTGSLV